MEFYKIVREKEGYQLETEHGQTGAELDKRMLCRLAQLLYDCYQRQEQLPLHFRRYLTAYYSSGEMEYIALAEAEHLLNRPALDGFATTWLEGEEENRVWFGSDGAVENRGPSGEKVRAVLEQLLQSLHDEMSGESEQR